MPTKLRKVLEKNKKNYVRGAWKDYSAKELAGIVSFFAKRSTHRSNQTKALKDVQDAENYLEMLRGAISGTSPS